MPAVLPESLMSAIITEPLELLCAAADGPRSLPATAVIVVHPDDEVIGTGARLPRLREAIFIHATDGVPRDLHEARAAGFVTRDEYAQARRRVLEAVLALVGIAPEHTRELMCRSGSWPAPRRPVAPYGRSAA
jgi:hypothetical protein